MKKELSFGLESKRFVGENKEFLNKLSGIVNSSLLGCLPDGSLKYSLDVFVSNSRSNIIKNQSLLYNCNLNLCCDKETNLKIFLFVYDEILIHILKDYSVGIGFIHDNKFGVVYGRLVFCVTRC